LKAIYIHKLFLSLIIILAAYSAADALELEITPREVVPGDVLMLIAKDSGSAPARADFLGNTIDFHRLSQHHVIAMVPVDVDTAPGEYAVAVSIGTEKRAEHIIVRPHSFKTIELTLPEGKVSLSPENQKRATIEAVRLNKLWGRNTEKIWAGSFTAPTDTETSTEFGVKRIMNKKKTSVHRGMDFRGKIGTPVKALNSGTAILNDDLFYGGNTLVIDHGMGLYSIYMHLSKINVSNGEKITKGQPIGLIGMSGRATGPHLHLSVKLLGVSVNPESLFKLKL